MNGLLLVAHGSKNGNDGIELLAQAVSKSFDGPVAVGYKRFGEPKLRKGLDDLLSKGAENIVAVPVFMSDGRYVESIPRNLGLDRGSLSGTIRHDGREIGMIITEPVGLRPEIPSIVTDTVSKNCPDADGVVLLGHSPGSGSNVVEALEALGLRVLPVTEPVKKRLPEAIDSLRQTGCSEIVVVQMRITPKDVSGLVEDGVVVTAPVGTSSEMAGLVLRIVRERTSDEDVLSKVSS